jgi:hypothetical protein
MQERLTMLAIASGPVTAAGITFWIGTWRRDQT